MRKPCCKKLQDTNKAAWSKQEDQKLIDYIHQHGEGCWSTVPQAAGLLRCEKSCRLRWINYLRPKLKRGNFGEDEEDLIIKLHALLGNRWSLIAGRLPGRTDYEVKNYWNSHLRKNLISLGIDPNNHRLNQTSCCQSTSTVPPPRRILDRVTTSTMKEHATSSSVLNIDASGHEYGNRIGDIQTAVLSTHQVSSCFLELANGTDQNTKAESLPDLNLDLTISMHGAFAC